MIECPNCKNNVVLIDGKCPKCGCSISDTYIESAKQKESSQLGHSDLRITERYACLEKKNIEAGKQRMSFIYDK